MTIKIKTKQEIELIRKSCKLASELLYKTSNLVKPGITTEELDKFAYDFIISRGAYPSPLNYKGFPKSICTSVNNVVCHGIPGNEVLKEGDIINIDVTCLLNGYHGDTSKTVCVGNVSDSTYKLVDITYKCLEEGISVIKEGSYLCDIGCAIQDVADLHGYSVVRDYCGHGIGRGFHEDPSVPHFRNYLKNVKIKEGMVFTVEPMLNEGRFEVELDKKDKWTVYTKDGSLSAQFEHTIAITENGPEILTEFL